MLINVKCSTLVAEGSAVVQLVTGKNQTHLVWFFILNHRFNCLLCRLTQLIGSQFSGLSEDDVDEHCFATRTHDFIGTMSELLLRTVMALDPLWH